MRNIVLLSICCMLIGACRNMQERKEHNSTLQAATWNTNLDGYSRFIPLDSGNKMLDSYLSSIDAAENDTDLFAMILVADSLRAYLQNPDVTHVKIMLAHSLEYINDGHQGQRAGYRNDALSLVIAGYNQWGDYVYHNGMVLERSMPCPTNCVTSGTASNNLLIAE
jgi:hypothetical protein